MIKWVYVEDDGIVRDSDTGEKVGDLNWTYVPTSHFNKKWDSLTLDQRLEMIESIGFKVDDLTRFFAKDNSRKIVWKFRYELMERLGYHDKPSNKVNFKSSSSVGDSKLTHQENRTN